jgi:putative zinc finger protein
MRECVSVDVRDLLPDVALGDGLSGLSYADRARVAEHLEGCAECRAELDMLRAARRAALAATPRVDVARIVNALPAPQNYGRTRVHARVLRPATRPTAWGGGGAWTAWRVAAVVSTVAVGGLSIAVLQNVRRGDRATSAPPVSDTPARVASPAPVGTPPEAPTSEAPTSQRPTPRAATPQAPTSPSATSRRSTARPGTAPSAAPATQVARAEAGLGVGGGIADLNDADLEAVLRDMDTLDASPAEEPDAASPALHAVAGGAGAGLGASE